VDLGALLPDACLQWLSAHGADIRLSTRVSAAQIEELQHAASLDNALLLACPAWDAARLTADIAPKWITDCP